MDWKIGDKFKISGIVNVTTHDPRVKTTGTITELLGDKRARAVLDRVEDETNIEAIIKLRDCKPLS